MPKPGTRTACQYAVELELEESIKCSVLINITFRRITCMGEYQNIGIHTETLSVSS